MNWKDYFYFERRDQTAIMLLLILIVVSGMTYASSQRSGVVPMPVVNDANNKTECYTAQPAKQANKSTFTFVPKLTKGQTVNINTADTTILKQIPGIGSGFAKKIITHRNTMGGYFSSTNQLKKVWGMDDNLFNKISPYITLNDSFQRLNINELNFDELNSLPYFSYKQAKTITDIRQRKGNISSLNHLSLLEEFNEKDLQQLEIYLTFE